MKLRDIIKMTTINDCTRSLFESIMMPELIQALHDWSLINPSNVLIGGLGLSYHARPRMTQDFDFLVMSANDIPTAVPGFKRIRPHAFQHIKTHVEVELLTPEFINTPKNLIKQVMDSSTMSNGVRVASASGIVVLKLGRLSMQDKADIIALIKTKRVSDLTEFSLPPEKMQAFQELCVAALTDQHP